MFYGWLAMLAAFLLVLMVATMQRQLRATSPVTWFLITYAIIFLVRPLVMVFKNDYSAIEGVSEGTLAYTGFVGAIGLICFAFGYWVALRAKSGGRLRLPRLRWPAGLTFVVGTFFMGIAFWTLYTLGLLPIPGFRIPDFLFGLNFTQLIREGASGYIILTPLFPTAILLLWASRFGIRWWVLAVAGMVWFIGLFGGWHRWMVVMSVLGLALVESARENRRRLLAVMILTAPLGLLVFTAIGRSRGLLPALLARKVTVQEAVDPKASTVNWDTDFSMYEGFVWAVQVYPRYLPYTCGQQYVNEWILGPIPRRLWPGKPVFGLPVLPILGGSNVQMGLGGTVSILGSFYADLGIVGVILGMTLFGWVLGFSYNVFQRHREKTYVLFCYCVLLALLPIAVRSGVVVLPAYFLFWLGPGVVLSGIVVLDNTVRGFVRRRVPPPAAVARPTGSSSAAAR